MILGGVFFQEAAPFKPFPLLGLQQEAHDQMMPQTREVAAAQYQAELILTQARADAAEKEVQELRAKVAALEAESAAIAADAAAAADSALAEAKRVADAASVPQLEVRGPVDD